MCLHRVPCVPVADKRTLRLDVLGACGRFGLPLPSPHAPLFLEKHEHSCTSGRRLQRHLGCLKGTCPSPAHDLLPRRTRAVRAPRKLQNWNRDKLLPFVSYSAKNSHYARTEFDGPPTGPEMGQNETGISALLENSKKKPDYKILLWKKVFEFFE